MPQRTGRSKNKGTNIHRVNSGKDSGTPPQKAKRLQARLHKGLSGQPLSLRGGR